jgi:hypothetical protein
MNKTLNKKMFMKDHKKVTMVQCRNVTSWVGEI